MPLDIPMLALLLVLVVAGFIYLAGLRALP
jgi:hypothetical protein